MKQVCISTFCVWNSYGSMLQAYGLQYALKQIGCLGTIASAKPAPGTAWEFPGFHGGIKGAAVAGHQLLIRKKLRKKYASANAFIEKNIRIGYFGSYDALCAHPPVADAYLAGSDQVWNPKRLDPAFFLQFVPEGKPRIAYAASMGITWVPEEKKADFARMVQSFDHISLRERDGLEVIQSCTPQPSELHLDPVFLVPREHWRGLAQPYPIEEPYILVYPIYWDKRLNRELKRLQEKTGKKIVAVLGQVRRVYAGRRIYDASPEQLLWLIDHADAVVSSSFHGIAMALVLEKPFAAVVDPQSASRLTCLLETLGIENAHICALAEECTRDWAALERKILRERSRSMTYLRKVIYGP